jgi:CheY-like chemotaxis protein
MESLLTGWGCRVLKATDRASAIDVLARSQVAPDGLLVDYHVDEG